MNIDALYVYKLDLRWLSVKQSCPEIAYLV